MLWTPLDGVSKKFTTEEFGLKRVLGLNLRHVAFEEVYWLNRYLL